MLPDLHILSKNFRSYPEIDWALPSGLTLLDGQNEDTGGSNFSGKTTLLDSWFWCRYGWLPKWGGPKGGLANAVVKRGTKGCWVKVTERFSSDEIKIKRERPSRLRVWKNGVEIKSIDQKGLDELLGMSAYRFLCCVYLPQKRKNSFFYMGDKERMDLLSIISGLEIIDTALIVSKEKRDVAKEELQKIEGQQMAFDVQLGDFPDKIHKIQEQQGLANEKWDKALKELDEVKETRDKKEPELIKERSNDFIAATGRLVGLILDIIDEIQSLSTSYKELKASLDDTMKPEPQLYKSVSDAKDNLSFAKQLNEDVEKQEKLNKRYTDKMNQELRLAEEAKIGTCGSCKQQLPQWDRNLKEQEHRKKYEEYKNNIIEELDEKIDLSLRDKKLDNAKEGLMKRKIELESLPRKIKAEMSVFESRINEKISEKKSIESEVERIDQEIKSEYNKKIKELKDAVDLSSNRELFCLKEVESLENDHNSIIKERKVIEDRLSKLKDKKQEKENDLNLSLDLIELFGPKGYRAVCFGGLVDRISDRAGYLLQIMTDGLYSTRLDQLKSDSKGNQKLILKPIVLKDSMEVPLDDLSGGAEDRIALAYDVAVSEAAGDGLPLLLDEVLTALDDIGKSEAMILLEEVSKSRPVVVVDHASEFKAMFNQVQTVIYQNGESRLEDSTYNQKYESSR